MWEQLIQNLNEWLIGAGVSISSLLVFLFGWRKHKKLTPQKARNHLKELNLYLKKETTLTDDQIKALTERLAQIINNEELFKEVRNVK
jgi:hypothetical protein